MILSKKDFSFPVIDNGKIEFDRTYEIAENNKLVFKTILTVKENNECYPGNITHFPIKKNELADLMNDAGFREIEIYKNYEGEAAVKSDFVLLFIGKK